MIPLTLVPSIETFVTPEGHHITLDDFCVESEHLCLDAHFNDEPMHLTADYDMDLFPYEIQLTSRFDGDVYHYMQLGSPAINDMKFIHSVMIDSVRYLFRTSGETEKPFKQEDSVPQLIMLPYLQDARIKIASVNNVLREKDAYIRLPEYVPYV